MKYLVYVCTNLRAENHPRPSCARRGSKELLEVLKEELHKQGLSDEVEVETATCLGACESGCTMLVHDDTTWYGGVTPSDIPELVEQHFKNGKPVPRLFIKRLMSRYLTGS
jgi:(2Fe-2S) ferredoxin